MQSTDILENDDLMEALTDVAKWAAKYHIRDVNDDRCRREGKTKEMCIKEFEELDIHKFFQPNIHAQRPLKGIRDLLYRDEHVGIYEQFKYRINLEMMFRFCFLESFIIPTETHVISAITKNIDKQLRLNISDRDDFDIREELRIKNNLLVTLLIYFADEVDGLHVDSSVGFTIYEIIDILIQGVTQITVKQVECPKLNKAVEYIKFRELCEFIRVLTNPLLHEGSSSLEYLIGEGRFDKYHLPFIENDSKMFSAENFVYAPKHVNELIDFMTRNFRNPSCSEIDDIISKEYVIK